jgi:hypothetical protein
MGWRDRAAPSGEAPTAGWRSRSEPAERFNDLASGVVGVGRGATLDFLDEIGGAIGAARLPRQIELGEAAKESAEDSPGTKLLKRRLAREQADKPSNYALTRDLVRKDMAGREAEDPNATMGGQFVGAVFAPIPGGSAVQGGKLGARLLTAAGKGAGVGAAYGLGSSEADLTKGEVGRAVADTAIGGVLGGAGGVVGQGLGELGGKVARRLSAAAGKKVAKADEAIDALTKVKILKDFQSASGELGAVTQSGNRLVENITRLEASGGLNAEQKAALQVLRDSGQWARLQEKLAGSNLKDLPGKIAEIESRESVLAGMNAGKEELFRATRKVVADPMPQIKPRLAKYTAPAVTALLGSTAGAGAGLLAGGSPTDIGVGALVGAGMRPGVHAVRRMVQSPAVQRPIYAALERAATAMTPTKSVGRAARPAANAADELADFIPALASYDDDKERMLATADALRKKRKH